MSETNGFSGVMRRVRSMLALANDAGATEGERNNAIRMAQATLAKYNLSMAEVAESAVERIRDHTLNAEPWERTVTAAIADLFFCELYYGEGYTVPTTINGREVELAGFRTYFIGRTANVATASELSQWVIASIRKQADKRVADKLMNPVFGRLSFLQGASVGIYRKAQELKKASATAASAAAAGTELVPVEYYKAEATANAAFLNKLKLSFVKGKSQTLVGGKDYSAGREYGSSINLNGQIAATGNNGVKLLK